MHLVIRLKCATAINYILNSLKKTSPTQRENPATRQDDHVWQSHSPTVDIWVLYIIMLIYFKFLYCYTELVTH